MGYIGQVQQRQEIAGDFLINPYFSAGDGLSKESTGSVVLSLLCMRALEGVKEEIRRREKSVKDATCPDAVREAKRLGFDTPSQYFAFLDAMTRSFIKIAVDSVLFLANNREAAKYPNHRY